MDRLFIILPVAVALSFAGTFVFALVRRERPKDVKYVGAAILSALMLISYLVHRSTDQDAAHFSLMVSAATLINTVVEIFLKRRPAV